MCLSVPADNVSYGSIKVVDLMKKIMFQGHMTNSRSQYVPHRDQCEVSSRKVNLKLINPTEELHMQRQIKGTKSRIDNKRSLSGWKDGTCSVIIADNVRKYGFQTPVHKTLKTKLKKIYFFIFRTTKPYFCATVRKKCSPINKENSDKIIGYG